MPIPEELKDRVEAAGQSHLFRLVDQLEASEQDAFFAELEKIDWQLMTKLGRSRENTVDWAALAARAEPAPAISLSADTDRRAEAIEHGERLLHDGKVALILVAGGQGTRLGFDKPKGMLPIGPISNMTLFQMLIEKALGAANYYGQPVPVLVMTSPATHDETVTFLEQNARFGLAAEDCFVFCQGTMPAIIAETGKLILERPGKLFQSPNGHGGMLAALQESGGMDRLNERGIEAVFYGQIDNPLLQVCDPLTLGYHQLLGSELTTQVVRKTEPMQRVGNVVSIDGKVQIIEYSDLPDEIARQRDDRGQLKLWAGNIAVHVFRTEFLNRVVRQPEALPYHRALKKVPYFAETGELVTPDQPNAIKFEKFIFDLLPHATVSLAIEINARDGFAAVKNALPATTETAETARAALIDLHTRWLQDCGIHVEPDLEVEISPRFAFSQKQLAEKAVGINTVIEPTYFNELAK